MTIVVNVAMVKMLIQMQRSWQIVRERAKTRTSQNERKSFAMRARQKGGSQNEENERGIERKQKRDGIDEIRKPLTRFYSQTTGRKECSRPVKSSVIGTIGENRIVYVPWIKYGQYEQDSSV